MLGPFHPRHAALAVLVAVTLAAVAGCSKSSPQQESNNPTSTAPSANQPVTAGDGNGSGNIVPLAKLAAIVKPDVQGVPEQALWIAAPTPSDQPNGDALFNLTDGDDIWMGVRFLDCNLPLVKGYATKPESERGDFTYCFANPNAELKGYPMFVPDDPATPVRTLKLGHLVILASIGASGENKLNATDVEAFLGSFDLTAVAELGAT